ncbi:MAG: HNH endonuclease signature motif containing protein [Aestuariivirga sp.]|nr:HNH endonuclease signature motif containing protein [Aestuariivirga sp.]
MANNLNLLAGLLSNNIFNDEKLIQEVWEKGKPVPGLDDRHWRYDADGRMICRSDHGKRDSAYGWEKDHIVPTAVGGLDILSNLRPLHCKGNSLRGGLLSALLRK